MAKKKKLNVNQELFCQYYVRNEWCVGNGTKSYGLAYGINIDESQENYDNCKVAASKFLTNPNIRDRINEVLDSMITDEVADRELQKVIVQDEERHAKVAALREYNALKKRVDNKIDFTGKIFVLPSEVIESNKIDINDTNTKTKRNSKGSAPI